MLGTLEFPGGLLKVQIAGPCPKVPLSVGLGWGLRTCLSTTFPGNEDAVGPAASLGEPLLYAELPFFLEGLSFTSHLRAWDRRGFGP